MSPRPGAGFVLDRFQIEALAAIDRGESVLVAAPTGSGKTLVAEHAVARAVEFGEKAFYTTPIKALSNQKYHDLVRRHGPELVGLLTGDNSINGDAPIVVMTTEVLRNMIYGRSAALRRLRYVILDEVHYLQDAYRGPVWEEVMIHLPPEVRLVCLSATVSNAAELAEWIETVRGPTAAVIETGRPVELANLYMVGDRSSEEAHLIATLVDGRPNPEGDRFDADRPVAGHGRHRRRWFTPRRVEVIDMLRDRDLLPVIYFIFSRAACDDAVKVSLDAGVRLTDPADRIEIRRIVESHVTALSDDDLDVLGYDAWLAGLEAGIASHHAGMVPPFKEAVEACFEQGLVRVVFATETLALGINMPARTVVLEKLTKFTGERHESLNPGQYTQITGRAGRRGIDVEGAAVVLWSPFVPFAQVAGLAGSRSFVLTSSFRPTYNMATNLVRRYQPDVAHHLLNLSFAQFQADAAVVRIETRLARRDEVLAGLRREADCELGDISEYLDLVDRATPVSVPSRRHEVDEALARLRPGDVVLLDGAKSGGRVAILSVANRRGGAVQVRVITEQRRVMNLGVSDFRERPEVIGRLRLPTPFAPRDKRFQREVSRGLHSVEASGHHHRMPHDGPAPEGPSADESLRRAHPVAGCADRDAHLRAARQAARVAREVADLRHQVQARTESLARRFDLVLQLLEAWGYLEGWELTTRGERLVAIFHESDLLVAEAVETGLFDDLDPAGLAGLASCFTYEHRSAGPPAEPWYPSGEVRKRVAAIERICSDLNRDEEALGLPPTRPPDPGFVALAHAWVAGEPLYEVLDDEDLSGGDFVRNAKLLIDLLRQIADATTDAGTGATARRAAEAMFRGVVAASSVVVAEPVTPEGGM